MKRTAQSGMNSEEQSVTSSAFTMETILPSSLRRRLSSPLHAEKHKMDETKDQISKVHKLLAQKLEVRKVKRINIENSSLKI